MILSLLTVGLILTGLGASATSPVNQLDTTKQINTEIKQQRENEQTYPNYNIDIQPAFRNVIHTEWEATNEYGITQSNLIQKNQSNTSNSVWNYNASKYTKNKIYNRNTGTGNFGFLSLLKQNDGANTQYDESNNMDLYTLQLTPINTPINNTIQLSYKATSGIDMWTSAPSFQDDLEFYIYTRVNILNTDDTYANKYIDASISADSNFNNWWTDVSNTVSNKTVQTHWLHDKIAEYNATTGQITNYQPNNQTTFNISINEGADNYIYIKIVRALRVFYKATGNEFNSMQLYWQDVQLYDLWGDRTGSYYNYYYTHNNVINLSGQYIPGTAQEIVDIPGIMWEIITMPFAFVSQAFNLTLFPGTQFSLNVSNLLLSIFGVLVFILLLKAILKR